MRLIFDPTQDAAFEDLEELVINQLRETNYLLPKPVESDYDDQIGIGNMVIDLIMVSQNMGVSIVDCLAAAYRARAGIA